MITVYPGEPLNVQTAGLSSFGCDPRVIAEAVFPRYPEEGESVEDVRPRVWGLL